MNLNHAGRLLNVPADADVDTIKRAYTTLKEQLRVQYTAAQSETDREVCKEKLGVLREARDALIESAKAFDSRRARTASEEQAKTLVADERRPRDSYWDTNYADRHSATDRDWQTGVVDPVEADSRFDAGKSLRPGGVLLDRYEIHAEVGGDSFGKVYNAFDRTRRDEVLVHAIPTTALRNREAQSRFVSEIRRVSAISHPGIAAIYAVHELPHTYLLATEFLEGQTLREAIETRRLLQHPFDLDETLHVAQSVCVALASMHRTAVHGDLRPENVFMCDDGHIKVTGLGMKTAGSRRTGMAGQYGDPFTAPECLNNPESSDPRSDQYSLAATLYEMLSAEPSAAAIRAQKPLPMSIPAPVGDAILRALRPDPAARFATIGHFAGALGVGEDRADDPRPESSNVTTLAHRSNGRWIGAAIVTVLIAALAVASYRAGWIAPTVPEVPDMKQIDAESVQLRARAAELHRQLTELRASSAAYLEDFNGAGDTPSRPAEVFRTLNSLVEDEIFTGIEYQTAVELVERAGAQVDSAEYADAASGYREAIALFQTATLRGRALETAALMLVNQDHLATRALHQAAESANLPLVKALVDLGAEIDAKNSAGRTASEVAASVDIRQYLEERMLVEQVAVVEGTPERIAPDMAIAPEPDEELAHAPTQEEEREAAAELERQRLALETTLARIEEERLAREKLERELEELQAAEEEARRKAEELRRARSQSVQKPGEPSEADERARADALAAKREQAQRELEAAQEALRESRQTPVLEQLPESNPPPAPPVVRTPEAEEAARLAAIQKAQQDAVQRAIQDEANRRAQRTDTAPVAPSPQVTSDVAGEWNVLGNRPEVDGAGSPIGSDATILLDGTTARIKVDFKELVGEFAGGHLRAEYATTIGATGRGGKGKTQVDQLWEIDVRVISPDRLEGMYRVTHRGFQASEANKNGTQSQLIVLTR